MTSGSAALCILVVDDWPEILQVYRWALQDMPATVLMATNGPQALALAVSVPVHLIILDMDLPGMDGLEICRHLKTSDKTRDIPIVFATGNAKRATNIALKEVGAVHLIIKPFGLDCLRDTVRRWAKPIWVTPGNAAENGSVGGGKGPTSQEMRP